MPEERKGEERETGDALGRGLQVGEMRECTLRPVRALCMTQEGGGGTPEMGERPCKVGGG